MINPAIAMANAMAVFAPASFKRRAGAQFVTPRARKQTDRGREFLESLQIIDIEAPKVVQRVYLSSRDGPLVFFQHGWEADSADLSSHAKALDAAGWRVALIDGPAHGGSEGRRAVLPDFSAGLASVADQLGQPVAVVAHSMGLPATVVAMTEHGLTPRAVVGLGGPHSMRANIEHQAPAMGLSARGTALLIEAVGERLGRSVDEFVIDERIAEAQAAALLIHGGRDEIVPPSGSQSIAQVWPGALCEIHDDLGHRGVLRDEAVIARVSEFLSAFLPA
ncbi:MAG: alpha/beta hydrolase [Pseudomonadota bacterium]